MKRTVIRYRNTKDGDIKVTGIENVASGKELREEFGERVTAAYVSIPPYYHRSHEQALVRIPNIGLVCIAVGDKYAKDAFGMIIGAMKDAGDRLQEIKNRVKEEEEGKEKEIII